MSLHLPTPAPSQLRFDRPGACHGWADHFPLGNGRLGLTVGGGINREMLRLNEQTIWSRSVRSRSVPKAAEAVRQVRDLLSRGRVREAEFLADAKAMASPRRLEPYQPFGLLCLSLHDPASGPVARYERRLDLDTAIASVRLRRRGAGWQHREAFVSHPDQVAVMRIQTGAPIDLAVELTRPTGLLDQGVRDGALWMDGQAGPIGTRFLGAVRVRCDGASVEPCDARLIARGVRRCVLWIAIETDYWEAFRGRPVEADYRRRVGEVLARAEAAGFEAVRQRHIDDHRSLYRRAQLSLGSRRAPAEATADDADDVGPNQAALKAGFQAAPEAVSPERHALQFNFARYLTIAASRPGNLPANLQGLWNDSLDPPWNSDFHTNINLQMNYWLAEVGNLADCHQPLLNWVGWLAETGRDTADHWYDSPGWVCHHNTDAWGSTEPGDAAGNGLWPLGGLWLALHLWEHDRYRPDRDWLAAVAYPVIRGAAEFVVGYLFEDDRGRLQSGPSSSPENVFVLPGGERGKLCLSPTMDRQVMRELLGVAIEAATRLDRDHRARENWRACRDRLAPSRIGPDGRLLEWSDPLEEHEPGHRHVSHLFGLFPGTEISPTHSPDLADAAWQTIEHRARHEMAGGYAGWSDVWKACMLARLHRVEDAHAMLCRVTSQATQVNLLGNAHGVMQFDSACGVGAAIAEMLLQSHEDEICLLPALPAAWPEGRFTGLRARGGYTLDAAWTRGRLHTVRLHADRPGHVSLRIAHAEPPHFDWTVVGSDGHVSNLTLTPEQSGRHLDLAFDAAGSTCLSVQDVSAQEVFAQDVFAQDVFTDEGPGHDAVAAAVYRQSD